MESELFSTTSNQAQSVSTAISGDPVTNLNSAKVVNLEAAGRAVAIDIHAARIEELLCILEVKYRDYATSLDPSKLKDLAIEQLHQKLNGLLENLKSDQEVKVALNELQRTLVQLIASIVSEMREYFYSSNYCKLYDNEVFHYCKSTSGAIGSTEHLHEEERQSNIRSAGLFQQAMTTLTEENRQTQIMDMNVALTRSLMERWSH